MVFSIKQTEGLIFWIGCSLFLLQVIVLIFIWIFDPVLAAHIIAVIMASTLGGRIASVLTGLQLGMHSVSLILILSVFNASWLLVFYPMIIKFFHHVMIKVKFVGKMLDSTRKTAERQKERITAYGTWGLAIFIWLPFPWTGALIGAVVGFLIGLSIKRTLLIVIPCMLLGIVSWVFGFKYLFLFTGSMGKIVSILILGVILSSSLLFRYRRA